MSEMIERVAAAIGPVIKEALAGGKSCTLAEVSRIAIEAMREPTTHMLFEGVVAQDGSAEVQGIYTAMIDAVLTETPS